MADHARIDKARKEGKLNTRKVSLVYSFSVDCASFRDANKLFELVEREIKKKKYIADAFHPSENLAADYL